MSAVRGREGVEECVTECDIRGRGVSRPEGRPHLRTKVSGFFIDS